MAGEIHKSSLRESLLKELGIFLEEEGLRGNEAWVEDVLILSNLISDYYEEGKHLYPELFITRSLENLRLTPSRSMLIKKIELGAGKDKEEADNGDNEVKVIEWNENIFKRILKECAPLAIDGWVIFVEVASDCIRYGVFSTEMTETTRSLYRQTVDEESLPEEATLLYIRSVGQKIVELRGRRRSIHVYLTLDKEIEASDNKVERLSEIITSGCTDGIKDDVRVYIEKVIDGALKAGHGNLIGVVEDNPETVENVKKVLQDGSYLEIPIDMANLVSEAETDKSASSTGALRAFASLMTSMINHDGITLLTNTGKLLGFHLFVKSQRQNPGMVGGARSRAFEAMKELGLMACFYKSQDGNMKIYPNE